MRLLVLGAGAQGSAAAFDLCQQPGVEQVLLADRELHPLPSFLLPHQASGKLVQLSLDASDAGALARGMEGVDAVLNALPYYFNLPVTRAAIAAGAHLCDLGGNTAIVEEQLQLAQAAAEAGVSVVPDCGLAPGMVNILAELALRSLDRTDSVRMYVGGLPRHPIPPINYQVVYSLEGVVDYYTSESMVLREGRPTRVEALSEVEAVDFPEPVGRLEAFHTAGGVSLLPHRYEGKVRTMEYKTLRFPGHAALMAGIRALGLFETDPVEVQGCRLTPRQAFIAITSPKLKGEGRPDMVVLRVEARGERGGTPVAIRYDLVDHQDVERGITAMMRTTGYSLAITALLQVEGAIAPGVNTPDQAMPGERYLELLAERGIRITRSEG